MACEQRYGPRANRVMLSNAYELQRGEDIDRSSILLYVCAHLVLGTLCKGSHESKGRGSIDDCELIASESPFCANPDARDDREP